MEGGLEERQTLQEALEAAQAEVQAARLEAARARVAAKFGLPEALATRLRGETETALETDARELSRYAPRRASPANPVGEPPLTPDELRRMSPTEINRRWEEVRRALQEG